MSKKNKKKNNNRQNIEVSAQSVNENVTETTKAAEAENEAVAETETVETEAVAEAETVVETEAVAEAEAAEVEAAEAEAAETEAEAASKAATDTVVTEDSAATSEAVIENAETDTTPVEAASEGGEVKNSEDETTEDEEVKNSEDESSGVEAEKSEAEVKVSPRPAKAGDNAPAKLRENTIPSKTHKERSEETVKAMESDARREARKKRRIRNQVISYVSVLVLILLVVAGAYFIVKNIVGFGDKKPAASVADSVTTADTENNEDIIADLIGDEEVIEEPVIDDTQIIEEPAPVPEEPVDELGAFIDAKIAGMTLEEKTAGLFLTSPEALTGVNLATIAGAGTQAALDTYPVGGLVYKKKNYATTEQFTNLLNGTLEMIGDRKVFIAYSEEGGASNSDIAGFGYYEAAASASEIAASYDNQQAFDAGVKIGTGLSTLGFNLDLAPVADLSESTLLKDRTYGTTAVSSAGFVKSMVEGLNSVGVDSCLKYFPGLGDTTSNPEFGRATTNKTEDEFRSNELLVYQAAIESGYAQMIMVSNVVVFAFDDSCPATLSETVVTGLLRNELNYKGVILSGDLSDKAITDYYGADEAAVMALKAGCDMLQSPEDLATAYNGIINAVNSGTISEERINDALERIYRILYADSF